MVGAGRRQGGMNLGGFRGKRRRGVVGKREGEQKSEGRRKRQLAFLLFSPDRLKIKSLKI